MNKFTSLLAVTLLFAYSPAWAAETRNSDDLTYCLDLKSNEEIAKCAGEISPGDKGKPLSKKEVERILSSEKASAPVSPDASMPVGASSGTPATTSPGKDFLPGKAENSTK